MKKYSILLVILFLLVSCENAMNDLLITANNSEIMVEKVATKAVISWDVCRQGILPSGNIVILPWGNSVQTSIPDDIRKDVKMEDGWVILDTTVSIMDYPTKVTPADSGVNYLIFYNTLTGVLKGFYYAETMTSNNCGFWQLSTSTPTRLFNFLPYFAEPMNGSSPQKAIISTVTTNGITSGFELGWNCFIQELAYDPNSVNQRLNITAFALDKAVVNLTGAYQSKSNGTIISTIGNKSSSIDGLATGIGSAAKEWVKENIGEEKENKPIKYEGTIIGSVLDKGISGFVSTGLYKVFGSLLGTTKTSMDLSFSTNGTATITGELINASSGLISPVAGLNLNNDNIALGVWNLTNKPIYATSRGGKLIDIQAAGGADYFYYQVDRKITIQLQVNPDFSSKYSYRTSAIFFNKYKGKDYPRLYDNYNGPRDVTQINRLQNGAILYSDSEMVVKESPSYYVGIFPNLWPNAGLGNNVGVYFENTGFNVTENSIVKVLLNWNKTIGGKNVTFYSSKTFIPTGELYYPAPNALHPAYWSEDELRARGFKYVPTRPFLGGY